MELKSLKQIQEVEQGNLDVLKEKWLMYLLLTKENNINLEHVNRLSDTRTNDVLNYVKRTLEILEQSDIKLENKLIIEEVLKWSEVAKCGMTHQRIQWENKGYNLRIHNIGSSQIYKEHHCNEITNNTIIINTLIETHGLIGQYLRGEVNISESKPLVELVGYINKEELKEIIYVLNKCIIKAVSSKLWDTLEKQVNNTIENIINNKLEYSLTLYQRLNLLRKTSINKGEDFKAEYGSIMSTQIQKHLEELLKSNNLWYVEAALSEFIFEEFIKILLILKESNVGNEGNEGNTRNISFEQLMKSIYYDYNNKKHTNIYKKRIIEWYLGNITINDILNNDIYNNEHVKYKITSNSNIINFNFEFSNPAIKLIEFCIEAQKSDILYKQATYLLYDLFGFRKDRYDRFHNEDKYLETMNQTVNHKSVILDYIVGDKVLDVGPGGGALMDLIEKTYPNKHITGIDISENVITTLTKRKHSEGRTWNVLKGNILDIDKYIEPNSVDTIIFSSILHELYSYVEYEGKKFNHKTLEVVLKNAFNTIKTGGRIIIRDGIMSENRNETRIIKFRNTDINFLNKYCNDFKGRNITYKQINNNTVEMNINDAMEFLYTYTWGEESYAQEVQEQFGYYTPNEYTKVITDVLGNKAKIIEFNKYLQEGYTKRLSEKIQFMDSAFREVELPDSTCLIVIEKI